MDTEAIATELQTIEDALMNETTQQTDASPIKTKGANRLAL